MNRKCDVFLIKHLIGVAILTASAGSLAQIGGSTSTAASAPALHVSGHALVNPAGAAVQLVGVDRSGSEYACVQGWGIFDGPSDPASVATIASWHANAVRIPLNEDCWLGINGVASAYSGANYRNAIINYVNEVNSAGMVAIVDLHWGAPGAQLATSQEQMPDASHAPAFWSSVAGTFVNSPGVIFDLFNEPHDVSWSCWLSGCTMANGTTVSGMQQLLNAVRSVGATQPVMVEGLNWAGDLSGWLSHEPSDPDHALVASAHLYNFSACNTTSCWNSTIAPVAASVPLVTGELGETDCTANYINTFMPWADGHGISYLAWAWDTGGGWSCSNGPALLNSYDGTPNAFGAGYRTHLAALAGTPAVKVSSWLTSSWGTGAVVDLHITNTGTVPLGSSSQPWSVTFSLPNGTKVTNMWNATLTSQSSGHVAAVAPSFEPSLAPGASIDVGWQEQGSQALPTSVVVKP